MGMVPPVVSSFLPLGPTMHPDRHPVARGWERPVGPVEGVAAGDEESAHSHLNLKVNIILQRVNGHHFHSAEPGLIMFMLPLEYHPPGALPDVVGVHPIRHLLLNDCGVRGHVPMQRLCQPRGRG